MNTMKPLTNLTQRQPQPLLPSLNPHHPSLSSPISSLSFTPHHHPLPSHLAIKSSLFSFPNFTKRKKSPKFQLFAKTLELNPFNPLFSLLKPTLLVSIATTALFFSKFHLKPAIAAPVTPPPTTQTDTVFDEKLENDSEREKTLEGHLLSNPNDVEALRNLMEIQIKNHKVQEAVSTIERLIELEPNDSEWPLLKAHMYCYAGEVELARNGFNELLEKDPFRVEAYHGLVMAASYDEALSELKKIEERIQEGIEKCRREKKQDDLRDFRLLIAQIRVIEGDYEGALMIYNDLVKEQPRDFRPYLCQGIIYSLLKKKDEAEKCFEKYRRLVPKGHPYARYFDDNMIATKLFAQKVENEKARSMS